MNDQPIRESSQRHWLDRLCCIFLRGEPKDRDQLVDLLRGAQQRDLLDFDALNMIEGVFQVTEMQVREIMVPRSQMIVVKADDELKDMLPTIVESAHSRFPVVGDNRDDIEGILLAKDLLRHLDEQDGDVFDLQDILRPAVMIPESKRLNVLLKEFRNNRNHMAIVVDEYGGVSGLVTIEDVLEQIVGDITDEHDEEEGEDISQLGKNRYAIEALMPLEAFNEQFGTQYDDFDFDTVGGLVLNRLGRLPKRGEALQIDRFNFKIMRADSRRIHQLHMEVLPEVLEPSISESH